MHVLTLAMEEAYAANSSSAIIYETMELNHITFDEPVRIITNGDEDMFLTVPGVGTVMFIACPVTVVLPGVTPDGPTSASVSINNISGLLNEPLNNAVMSDQPVTAIYRAYTSEDPSQPGDIIGGLELWDVELDVATARGTLRFRELELQAFPLVTYDEEFYPALQDAT